MAKGVPVAITAATVTKKRPPAVKCDGESPCDHNDWDNVRIKKGNHSLRCRVCQKQWKVHHSLFQRCPVFVQGLCDKNQACGFVHIHQFKESLKDRNSRFGGDVLSRVSPKVLGEHGMTAEYSATEQQQQQNGKRAEINVSTDEDSSADGADGPATPVASMHSLHSMSFSMAHTNGTATPTCHSRPDDTFVLPEGENFGVVALTDSDLDQMLEKLEGCKRSFIVSGSHYAQ
eukprot:Rhum_TRINITY_DN15126_c0_g2::Rhum_TRINITY_DN15126_c0_g2_i1::g.139888::m.139888